MAEPEEEVQPEEEKPSSISIPTLATVGFLTLCITILGTLEFVDRRELSQFKTVFETYDQQLVELKARLDEAETWAESAKVSEMTAAATAVKEQPASGDNNPLTQMAATEVTGSAREILEKLELLSKERDYVIKEIKGLRGRVAKLNTQVGKLKRAARKSNKQGKKDPTARLNNFVIAWSAQQAHKGPISTLRFSPDNEQLATAGLDNAVRLWGVSGPGSASTLTGHSKGVTSISYSPDGAWLASSSADRTIKLWHATTGAQVRTFMGHRGSVDYVGFADSSSLVSAGADSHLNLWNSDTGTRLRLIADLPKPAGAVAYSPWHPVLALAIDNEIELWNIETGVRMGTLSGHTAPVKSLAFSADGFLLASGGEDKVARIWSVGKRQSIQGLLGHQQAITGLAFSPDGKLLATAAKDGQLWLWQVKDGSVMQELPEHSGGAVAVAFSADGRWLASADAQYTLHMWHSRSPKKVAMKQSQ